MQTIFSRSGDFLTIYSQ